MIEQKLLVGRFINFTFPNLNQTVAHGTFITQAPISMTIEESTGFFKKTSAVVVGSGVKAHRNFQWLGYVLGVINQVSWVGLDILTGPMSGCWITRYRIGGVEHVGHIGTWDVPEANTSVAAKAAWNAFAIANAGDVIGGFKPKWNGDLPARVPGDNLGIKQFGLVTATGEYYTVFTYKQNETENTYRIAGIQTNTSATLQTLQNL